MAAARDGAVHRCFVGGLALATHDRDLEVAFAPFGEILSCKIIYDRETGRSRGFGFVTFSTAQAVRDAIQGMNGKMLDGRTLTVNEARPRGSAAGGGGSDRRGLTTERGSVDSMRRLPTLWGFPDSLDRAAGGMFGDMFGRSFPADFFPGEASSRRAPPQRKDAPIQHLLPCDLADLYKGATKKIKITRQISDPSGRQMAVEEILRIDIKPGWKKGTKITFAEKGNEAPNVIPADIVFIIDEKPHNQFTREGNDLVMNQKISLAENRTTNTVHVTTLDGRNLAVPISSADIHHGDEEVVSGEGMPFPKDPSKKGNLRIKFSINVPLTRE